VALDASAIFVAQGKGILGPWVSVNGRFPIPLQGLFQVLLDAVALFVHQAEIELRLGKVLVGSPFVPLERLSSIFFYSQTFAIEDAQVVLGLGVPFFRQDFPALKGRCVSTIPIGSQASGKVSMGTDRQGQNNSEYQDKHITHCDNFLSDNFLELSSNNRQEPDRHVFRRMDICGLYCKRVAKVLPGMPSLPNGKFPLFIKGCFQITESVCFKLKHKY